LVGANGIGLGLEKLYSSSADSPSRNSFRDAGIESLTVAIIGFCWHPNHCTSIFGVVLIFFDVNDCELFVLSVAFVSASHAAQPLVDGDGPRHGNGKEKAGGEDTNALPAKVATVCVESIVQLEHKGERQWNPCKGQQCDGCYL
jgi:hypothetical protein